MMGSEDTTTGAGLEARIADWRARLARRPALVKADVAELEDHLRSEVAALMDAGLDEDEAFLVAVKRVGALDELTREFAREHSGRLWKQLLPATVSGGRRARVEIAVVVGLGAAAAVALKLPELLGLVPAWPANFHARNLSLFVLPFLTAYFAWKRDLAVVWRVAAVLAFVGAAALVNLSPFETGGDTEILAVLHLPMALWLVVGLAYTGGRWSASAARMNFVRFSGELFLYFVLIALGGGVITLLTMFLFQAIGIDPEGLAERWILPCGAMGAVLVAAWLVEAKQSVVENLAPVLTRLFTPLLLAALVAFLGAMAWTGAGIDVGREVLIGFDFLLAVVVGLLLYAISARDPRAPPNAFDALQLALALAALVVDALALAAIASRISDFGFTPNRVAALGENLILLVNLGWSAWLYGRFLLRRGPFDGLARWQTAYLPVYSAWAAFVVLAFPPLFGYR